MARGRERILKRYRILIPLFVCAFHLQSATTEVVTQWQPLEDDSGAFSTSAIGAITFSPDGTRLALAHADGITLYDTYTGNTLTRFAVFSGRVVALAFSPDNRIIASATEDSTIDLWNVYTGKRIAGFMNHHGSPIVTLRFSPDGNTLAGGSFKEIRLWDLTFGARPHVRVLRGHRDMVTTLAFSPDNKMLASASFYDTILLWDLEKTQLRYRLTADTDPVLALAFSSDSRTLASGGYWNSEADSTIQVWNTRTGQGLTTFENRHTAPVFALAFPKVNRDTFASAGWDNTIRIWDIHTGELQAIFEAATAAPVLALTFLTDRQDVNSNTLASASLDGTIQLRPTRGPWDVNNDGVVDILDLTLVASRFGQDSPDINADGVINILDLMLVAQHIR